MGLSLTRVDIDPLRKMDFFRHCPECGRRFQIRLVDKKLVRQERGSIPTREIVSGEYRYGMSFRGGGTVSGPPTVVLEGRPIVVDIKNFSTFTNADTAVMSGQRSMVKNRKRVHLE